MLYNIAFFVHFLHNSVTFTLEYKIQNNNNKAWLKN